MKEEKKIVDTIMKSILFFPVLTIFQSFKYLELLNKIWMGLVLLELLVSFKYLKYRKFDFIIFIITIFIHIFAYIYTNDRIYNINMMLYLMVWVLFYLFFAMHKELIISFFRNNVKYIKIILNLWTLIVGFSILIPSCYDATGSFVSFVGSSFRLMPTVLMITSMIIFLRKYTGNRKYNFYLLIPIYTSFMGYSRTYFIVFLIILFIYFYMSSKSKIRFFVTLIPMTFILLLAISFTSIGDKIDATTYTTSSYLDFWGTVTSGRSIFWKIDMEAFKKLSFLKRFIGNGYNFVYDINLIYHGRKIWAHNDFINLLMNFGYFGIVVYIYSFCRMIKALLKKENISKSIIILFLLAVFINSFFNMSYTYLCATISYPMLLIAFLEKDKAKEIGKVIKNE